MPCRSLIRSIGAPSNPFSPEPVARSIAYSPLVKTALHGADPNFGRILQAAGQVLPPPFVVDLDIEGQRVVTAGEGDPLDAAELSALEEAVAGSEVEFECGQVDGVGTRAAVVLFDAAEGALKGGIGEWDRIGTHGL